MAYEYIVKGKVVTLPVSTDKVAVRFRETLDTPGRRAVIDPKAELGSFDDRYEVPNEKLTIVGVAKPAQPGPLAVASAVTALSVDPDVERAAPVFVVGSQDVVAPNRLIVGFKPDFVAQASQIVEENGAEIVRELGDGGEYVVRLSPSSEPFDVIANLAKRVEVDYAEPDFVTIGQHQARNASADGDTNPGDGNLTVGPDAPGEDPLLKFQYAAQITGCRDAWKTVSASSSIKIAILDEGVDTNHPDLSSALVAAFDAVDGDGNQQPNPWDAHGTACAGLAAAIPNNAVGVRGMGGGCSLLAVRIASSPAKGAKWAWADQHAVDGIDWAWKNGADVLSNSWGGGAPSNAITNAFERARTKGRGNKGCVILVAAGNESAPVSFPATLDNVLTISASNEFDEPKTKSSADGETWWGSNFGPQVDLAAPGVHNYTTDIVGADGYNTGGPLNPDYVANFNGTSSATPIVAGIAGLILSVNPNLREEQVRRLLKQTADKVGHVVYANGRNDQMGNGRVNALRAVQDAVTFV
jgi:thermitase